MTNKELIKQQKQDEARKIIKNHFIKPNDTILIVIKKVSSSGMCRRMKVLNKRFQDITRWIADLCDLSANEYGLKIQGCGMDTTFWLADRITHDLYGIRPKVKGLNGNGSLSCLKWKSV